MDLQFTINRDLCIQCGACVADCPFRIIVMQDDYPALDPKREHHCIHCQHCLAVCPTGALSILGVDPEKSIPLRGTLPTAEQVNALLRGRRSVRRFCDNPVPVPVIDALLATAANAPTGKNMRQCLFTVMEDRESMEVLRRETMEGIARAVKEKRLPTSMSYYRYVLRAWNQGRDLLFRNAPHLLMVSVPENVSTPEADMLIAMTYFEIYAASQGIGTLWNAMISEAFAVLDTDMYGRLGIPADHVKGYALLFGYPAVRYHRTVQRDQALINRVRLR